MMAELFKTLKRQSSFTLVLLVSIGGFVLFSSFGKPTAGKTSFNLAAEEKSWMEPFFRGIMLQHNAIYTLYGSKPMTIVSIDINEEVQGDDSQRSKQEKKKRIIFENYHLLQNWENWEKVKARFHVNRYAFFKKADIANPDQAIIYFADMTKIALTLQENYDLFKRETGLDFDPLSESLSLEQGSKFWTEVFDNSALLGMLLGYGIKNSFCFQWKYGDLSDIHEKLAESLLFRFSDKPQGGKATFDKLSLPIFASFSEGEDEVIEKYKREREMIRSVYENKDFLNMTLQKLTQVDQQ